MISTRIKPNLYKDSVALMRIAEKLLADPAITRATLVMATPANKDILKEANLLADEADRAGPSDLIVVVEADSAAAADAAYALVDSSLVGGSQAGGGEQKEVAAKSINMAVSMRLPRLGDANLARGIRGDIVVGRGDDGIDAPGLAVGDFEPFERLRARHLMDQVAVDVDERGTVGLLADEVRVPELFVQGAGHGGAARSKGQL